MEAVLMHLQNVSVQAILIFCTVIIVRGLFSLCRAPKKYACGLWAILFIRLLLPVQLESAFGVMPQGSGIVTALLEGAGKTGEQERHGASGDVGITAAGVPGISNPAGEGTGNGTAEGRAGQAEDIGIQTPGENSGGAKKQEAGGLYTAGAGPSILTVILSSVWLGGAAVLLLYSLLSYVCLKKRLRCSISLEACAAGGGKDFSRICISGGEPKGDRIYFADGIGTPFVLGLLSPRIYLPSAIGEKDVACVIAHERMHIRRGDPFLKMAAFFIACVYWFHPVIWLGFLLLGRDMELSCDEAVMGQTAAADRRAYAESLLRLTCGTRYSAGAPLAFSEGNTKGRIKHIMKYKKPAGLTAIFAAVLLVALAAALLTSPRAEADGDGGTVGGEDFEDVSSVKKTELECVPPDVSGDAILGADGAILDYADENMAVFHDYFGLYVYSEARGSVIGSLDLKAIGCEATQGDGYCEVYTAQGGAAVYLHPLGMEEVCTEADGEGTVRTGLRDYGYCYEPEAGRLYRLEYCVYGREEGPSALFRETAEKMSGVPLAAGVDAGWLKSEDWTVGNLVYVRHGRYTALFGRGAEGDDTLSIGSGTKVWIGGTEYDLAEREGMINAVTAVSYVNGMWIVEGHINPNVGSYSFYDTEDGAWKEDVFGSCLTWDSQSEIRLGTDILDTLIYERNNRIYDYEGYVVAVPELEEGEYLTGLIRQGDSITAYITSIYEEEGNRRELALRVEQRRRHI